jgi:RNA polymerase sigma-70 factor (ECF subfamily)
MAGGNSAARAPGSPARPSLGFPSNHDPLTFSAIYQAYFDFVWSSVRRLGAAEEAVDDVVQDVFVIIHSRLHTVQQPDSIRSWVYGVVRRTVSGYHRARRVRGAHGVEIGVVEDTLPAPQTTPFEQSEHSDQVQLLAKLLTELDEAKREIFVLAELEEMAVPEIALALEIPLNTAYSRLRTARLAFEQALARHLARDKRAELT